MVVNDDDDDDDDGEDNNDDNGWLFVSKVIDEILGRFNNRLGYTSRRYNRYMRWRW